MEITSRKGPERALRLRNNKRLHRARQKEYTADLERRLRELQQQGVQASIEIQLSARKVVHENERLRRLLQHVGVAEETINSWADGKQQGDGESFDSSPKRPCLRKPAGGACGQAYPDLEDTRQDEHDGLTAVTREALAEQASCPVKTDSTSRNLSSPNDHSDIATESSARENAEQVDHAPPSSCSPPEACDFHINRNGALSSAPASNDTSTSRAFAPCKLLTHLAANPSADITQMHTLSNEKGLGPEVVDDGIPCSRAYQMLIQYATTESKLDAVAHVLEEGCVPNAGPAGGCAVKSKTILKALDDICL